MIIYYSKNVYLKSLKILHSDKKETMITYY
jgi:hypothetical protein